MSDARSGGSIEQMSEQRARSGTCILGISADYHDAAAALVVDGALVAACEQERFSRRKHDASLPAEAVAACLEIAGRHASEIDHVVFYEKPLVAASRFLATRQRQGPRSLRPFLASAPTVVGTNVMVGARLAKLLRRLGSARPPRVAFVEHHRSHAAAAFFPSPFEHAAVLTIDGLGEWSTATIARGAHHGLTLLEEQRFPDSLGLVYSFITAYCGFSPNDDEYKVMGLAPYGRDRFGDAIGTFADLREDGTLRVDPRVLRWFGDGALEHRAIHRLLGGPPRRRGDPITAREADLAASVQALTERAVLAMARRAHRLTGERRLCLGGGVALNCVANGVLAREGPFEDIWIQPAAGDAGSAVGAALSHWHEVLGHHRLVAAGTDGMAGALLGPEIDDEAVVAELLARGVPHRVEPDPAERDRQVARRLAEGAVVGWFQGRMEFGPRALGARSILADPRSPTVRERLNLAVKGRESFRPFGPAVLEREAGRWFELAGNSPYMLVVAPLRAEHLCEVDVEPTDIPARARVPRSTIPACTHVDGTARVQTVSPARHPQLASLLEAFFDQTGCPILLNTSFNRAGEPIVASVGQALAAATAGGLDLLAIGSALVDGSDLS